MYHNPLPFPSDVFIRLFTKNHTKNECVWGYWKYYHSTGDQSWRCTASYAESKWDGLCNAVVPEIEQFVVILSLCATVATYWDLLIYQPSGDTCNQEMVWSVPPTVRARLSSGRVRSAIACMSFSLDPLKYPNAKTGRNSLSPYMGKVISLGN